MTSNIQPLCSLIIVHYNGITRIKNCLNSLDKLSYSNKEIIIIDNGSTDDSVAYLQTNYPQITTLINPENNFAKALNLGINHAQGKYIGFLNNDILVDSEWLTSLVTILERDDKIGAAGGKILLKDGRINSVGVQELPDFFWQDLGFGEKDTGQYEIEREAQGLCWAAVLFRSQCLAEVGAVDEDFVMYFEDVEYCYRCLSQGWKLFYTPKALAEHEFGASSTGSQLTQYFCNRNRFLYLAKHRPDCLVKALNTSVFLIERQYNFLQEALFFALKKLLENQTPDVVAEVLPALTEKMTVLYGKRTVDKLRKRLQVVTKQRQISLGIYDHGLHFIGGGQKYSATLAEALQHDFEITFIANKPITLETLETWYGLNLSECKIKIIPLPFYEKRGMQSIDSSLITAETENPFEIITKESQNYDIFLNANQLEKVKPLAPISIFTCHFPNSFRGAYFAVDDYTFILTNSQFGSKWLNKRWQLNPTFLLYPPVEMTGPQLPKEKIILSVAQLEAGGTKKQLEMIAAFQQLKKQYPEIMEEWKLILIGGSVPGNPYLKTLQNQLKPDNDTIQLKINLSRAEIQNYYSRSTIFWHLCGLEEINPQRCEHFGMATVEAMQNYCIPIAANAGGQKEIIEPGISGFLCNTLEELREQTHQLLSHPEQLTELQNNAYQRSQNFSKTQFVNQVKEFFTILKQEYETIQRPNPAAINRD